MLKLDDTDEFQEKSCSTCNHHATNYGCQYRISEIAGESACHDIISECQHQAFIHWRPIQPLD